MWRDLSEDVPSLKDSALLLSIPLSRNTNKAIYWFDIYCRCAQTGSEYRIVAQWYFNEEKEEPIVGHRTIFHSNSFPDITNVLANCVAEKISGSNYKIESQSIDPHILNMVDSKVKLLSKKQNILGTDKMDEHLEFQKAQDKRKRKARWG